MCFKKTATLKFRAVRLHKPQYAAFGLYVISTRLPGVKPPLVKLNQAYHTPRHGPSLSRPMDTRRNIFRPRPHKFSALTRFKKSKCHDPVSEGSWLSCRNFREKVDFWRIMTKSIRSAAPAPLAAGAAAAPARPSHGPCARERTARRAE